MKQETTDIVARFESLAPWVHKFRIGDRDYGGTVSAVGDVRLKQFFEFVPEPRRILELGSLEGAHSVQLAAHPGVEEVIAIEGRRTNILKAELVRRALGVRNVTFTEANLETENLSRFGRFDAVFCVGLLYHLPEPWQLIEQVAQLAPRLFLWTHYADDLAAGEIQHGCRGQIHQEGGPDEPLSGLSATAFWPTLGSLVNLLTASGYTSVTIVDHEPRHPNAPAVTIAAEQV